jgi:hypothetical protein
MKTTVSLAREIVLRAKRQRDHIKAEHQVAVERVDRGEYRLVRRATRANEGVVDWLFACPKKDFLVPIESQATSTM